MFCLSYTFLASQDPVGSLREKHHRPKFPFIIRYILAAMVGFALRVMLDSLLRLTDSTELLGRLRILSPISRSSKNRRKAPPGTVQQMNATFAVGPSPESEAAWQSLIPGTILSVALSVSLFPDGNVFKEGRGFVSHPHRTSGTKESLSFMSFIVW
jgi:hypothetical protein